MTTLGTANPGPDENSSRLRLGYTTGTCAAAAAKAAALAWFRGEYVDSVSLTLPAGERCNLAVHKVERSATSAVAQVQKDAGDDPDVTHGLFVCVSIAPLADNCTRFVAGEGVGVVTLPGLSVPPGEAAINPEPRRQILAALREVTEASVEITISIPGGAKVAEKTYNPRLGVKGGLSILGTDGRVRPFSHERRLAAVLLALDVAHAQGVTAPVLVPGHQGRRQALMQLACSAAAVVEAGNDFAPMLERCRELGMRDILILGHPGKLAKLAEGEFDTHSSRSRSALCAMERAAQSLGISLEPSAATTEAALDALDDSCRSQLCQLIAARIQASVLSRSPQITVAVRLNNLAGKVLATFGDITPWLLSSLSLPS